MKDIELFNASFQNFKGYQIPKAQLIIADVPYCYDTETECFTRNGWKDFRGHNFEPSSYKSKKNKDLPMYYITKDGFSFLVMGYTGAKAGEFKERFINEFNNK